VLSLQLKSGEYLTIGEDIVVQTYEQSGGAFSVAVKAPKEVPILRGDVHERTGERPKGLYRKRPQSPSERRYNAKHFEQWVKKIELREDGRNDEATEKTNGAQE